MAIDDASTIDALGIDPETGDVLMIISDHLDWSDPVAHVNMLQNKVNAYLGFMNSGQLDENMPEGVGRHRQIVVIQQFEPNETAHQLLRGIGELLTPMTVGFSYGPLPDGYDSPA